MNRCHNYILQWSITPIGDAMIMSTSCTDYRQDPLLNQAPRNSGHRYSYPLWGYNPFDAASTYHYFSACFHVDSETVRIYSITNSITKKSSRFNIFNAACLIVNLHTMF